MTLKELYAETRSHMQKSLEVLVMCCPWSGISPRLFHCRYNICSCELVPNPTFYGSTYGDLAFTGPFVP